MDELKKKGSGRAKAAILDMVHSIRTQYSLATAFFLLLVLGVFYIGGRIVLVHMVREAEAQVKEIGMDISRLAYRTAAGIRQANQAHIVPVARDFVNGDSPTQVLAKAENASVSLVADYSPEGKFLSGAVRGAAGVEEFGTQTLAAYAERIDSWIEGLTSTNDASTAVGIMRVMGSTHYVSMARYEAGQGGYLIVGSPFDPSAFTAQANAGAGGAQVRVTTRKAEVGLAVRPAPRRAKSSERNAFGLAPMLSEALDFYSGGFWDIGSNPFEAVFAIRDIAGNPITMIAVSLPQTFSNVTSSALGRMTFFIAMAGIVFILPIFWFQSRLLLNPLTKMTAEIRKLAARHRDADCPRLEWKGKDEFALLAASVNSMLETISARAVELAQLETRQRALIDGVPDALAVFDRRGRLASVTKQPVGVPPLPGFAVGEAPSAAVYGDMGVVAFTSAVSRVFEDAIAQNIRLKVQRPAGVPRSVPTRHFEVRVSRMDEFFALAIIRDVTQEVAEHKLRLAAEQRMLDSSKRESLTLLAAGIAHDVNNVLSVILSTAEAALMDAARDEVKAEMDVIRDAVKRGSAMTKELMTYAGETRIQLVRASPGLIVKDVQMLAERVIGRNVSLEYVLDPAAPDVDVDASQFWKVLFNIVKNAGEALGSRPGRITLSTETYEMTREAADGFISERPLEPGRGVMFRIADDGPGIRPDLLPRLFDPYFSSKSLGRGLGLATVRTIVESHGGGIKVTSALDQGTTFHIWLPESRMPADPAAETRPQEKGELPAEVLVVDNDEAILKTTSILLRALKVTPHVAHDRHESLGIMRRRAQQIGAILLDANLGGIDTVRLLEAFRIIAPGTPVIVSSGSSEESLRKMFESHPFDAFLGKPYTIAELKELLMKCNRA